MPSPLNDEFPRPHLTIEAPTPNSVAISNKGNVTAWNCHIQVYRKKRLKRWVVGKPVDELTHRRTIVRSVQPGQSVHITLNRSVGLQLRRNPPFYFTFVATVSDPFADPLRSRVVDSGNRQITVVHGMTPGA